MKKYHKKDMEAVIVHEDVRAEFDGAGRLLSVGEMETDTLLDAADALSVAGEALRTFDVRRDYYGYGGLTDSE